LDESKGMVMSSAKSKKALYAGSFDPFTNGHADILERSLKVFDEVIILVAFSPNKTPFISVEDRVKLIQEIYKGNPQVKVDSWSGLTVDYAKEKGIHFMVRGLRPSGDFEGEFQMATMNHHLNSEVESVFFMTGKENFFVSSSLIKEISGHGADISDFVPKEVLEYLKSKK
jgi:pantetheine-phosphate adenylyltransferase